MTYLGPKRAPWSRNRTKVLRRAMESKDSATPKLAPMWDQAAPRPSAAGAPSLKMHGVDPKPQIWSGYHLWEHRDH